MGGLAAALLADSAFRNQRLSPGLLIASAAVAVAPDLDLLTGSHRTYTHSVGAVFLVGVMSWFVVRGRASNRMRAAAVLMAAYASHMVLDWSGKDTSNPAGLTLLWPFSSTYYVSGWNLFGEVSRRYWLPDEFVLGNLAALAWEMLVLVPVFVLAWVTWSRRTVTTKNEKRKTNKVRTTR